MNQGAFLMKGLDNVRAEFSLTALVYNLRRALNRRGDDGGRPEVTGGATRPTYLDDDRGIIEGIPRQNAPNAPRFVTAQTERFHTVRKNFAPNTLD
jgi:hypothetical protein